MAAEVKMISAMALHATWLELVPIYEKAGGGKVSIVIRKHGLDSS